jgi:hypothetical protein
MIWGRATARVLGSIQEARHLHRWNSTGGIVHVIYCGSTVEYSLHHFVIGNFIDFDLACRIFMSLHEVSVLGCVDDLHLHDGFPLTAQHRYFIKSI